MGAANYNEHLQRLVADYRAEGNEWPTDMKTVAGWAVRTKRWEPTRKSAIDLLAPQLARALREEYFTDPQGRRVRKKHAIRQTRETADGGHEQYVLWVDEAEATHEQMEMALQQRRQQILGDCRQLKTDMDSYNDNRAKESLIQMSFDFTEDLEELEMPEDYVGV